MTQKNKAQDEIQKPVEFVSQAILDGMIKQEIRTTNAMSCEKARELRQERRKRVYHNTLLLLTHYRDIAWLLECFPEMVAEELDSPFENLDALIDRMDVESAFGNRKLEKRMESIKKSRLLIDRINEALTVLRKKPDNGSQLYDLIFWTYISPEKLNHAELLYRLNLSSRHYYRLREQAVTVLSIRLWAVPDIHAENWLDVLVLLEEMNL